MRGDSTFKFTDTREETPLKIAVSRHLFSCLCGGGHTWPGGEPRGGFLGATSEDINANELIWTFFMENGL